MYTCSAARRVRIDGGEFRVYDAGPSTGIPLVFLHGYTTSAFTWRDVYPRLGEGLRPILLDLPGSNGCAVDFSSAWSMHRLCDCLHELLELLGVKDPILVGSQMGGSLAAWYAGKYPSGVRALVIMAAGALGEAATNMWLYRALAHPVLGHWLCRCLPRSIFHKRWVRAHGPASEIDLDAEAHYFSEFRRTGSVQSRFALEIRASYGRWFDRLVPLLEGLDTPTLLIWGAHDSIVPPSTGERFREVLPNSELVILSGRGDFPQEEAPEEVAIRVQNFIGALPAREPRNVTPPPDQPSGYAYGD